MTLSQAHVTMITQAVARQGFTRLLGAEILALDEGMCRLGLRRREELLQQHGLFHGGVIGYLVDNAAAIAAGTLLRPGEDLLSAEFKVNYLRPAKAAALVAEARVIKPGRRITVVSCGVFGWTGEDFPAPTAPLPADQQVAAGLATIAMLPARQA